MSKLDIDNSDQSRQSVEYSACGHSVFEGATFKRNVLDALGNGSHEIAKKALHNTHHYDWPKDGKLLDSVPDLSKAIISSAKSITGNTDFAGLGALQLRLRNLNLLQARPESANTSMDTVIEFWSVARQYRDDRFLGEVAANVALVCREIDKLEGAKNPQAGFPCSTEFFEYVIGTEQGFLSQNSPSILRFWLAATCHATYFHQFAEVDREIQTEGRPLYDSMIKFGNLNEVDLVLRSIDSFVVHIQKNPSIRGDYSHVSSLFLKGLQELMLGKNPYVSNSDLEKPCQYNDRAGIEVASESIRQRTGRLERLLIKLT